jgi:hypothetical protein
LWSDIFLLDLVDEGLAMSDQGHMDVRPHQDMWKNFTRLMTWSVAISVIILVLMAVFLL